MWRWMEMKWREEIELVKWKYARNCDNKRAEVSARIVVGENNDSILWLLPSNNCHHMFFFVHCIEIIATYSNIYSPNDLPDSQCSSTQTRLNIWRALNLLTTSIFLALPLRPSFLALESFMVLYANSTVCHEVFKNSANFYGFFRTIHFTRVVFFAFVCRYLNVYILFQSTMIHAFNRKLIYLIAILLSRQLIWFIKMQYWALFLLALFFALFYSFAISLCVWIKDYYHHIACVHTLPLSDCRVKWKWIFVWRNENICATLTE